MNKKVYSGYVGDLSPEQEGVLAKLREHAASQGLTKYDDTYLLRFCRARKFEMKAVLEMWDNFVKWRLENDVDNIENFQYTELPLMKTHYKHGYYKTDKQGRPLYIERIGQLNIDKLFEVTTEDRLVKYYIQSYEHLINKIFPACSKKAGKKVEQTLTILDLEGVSLSMIGKRVYNFIKLASNIGQNYYPEILGKMYIVNAPFLFSGVWACIKPWLDEKTKNKIQIIGSGYREELLKNVDAENLPDFLGGQSRDDLCISPGPWNEIPKPLGSHPAEETKNNEAVVKA